MWTTWSIPSSKGKAQDWHWEIGLQHLLSCELPQVDSECSLLDMVFSSVNWAGGCMTLPKAAATNDHKLGDMKQQSFVLSQSGGKKVRNWCQQGHTALWFLEFLWFLACPSLWEHLLQSSCPASHSLSLPSLWPLLSLQKHHPLDSGPTLTVAAPGKPGSVWDSLVSHCSWLGYFKGLAVLWASQKRIKTGVLHSSVGHLQLTRTYHVFYKTEERSLSNEKEREGLVIWI